MNQLLLVIFFSFPLFGSLVSLVQFLWPLLGGHFVASCGWMALDAARWRWWAKKPQNGHPLAFFGTASF